MTALRLLPDAEGLVQAVLDDVPSSNMTPAKLATRLPCRVVYKIGGTASHPRFLDKPQIHVTSYANTREGAADLAETARVALFLAWRNQDVYSLGVVHRVTEALSPTEVRTGTEPDGVFRFDATYMVWTRPHQTD